MSSPRAFPNSVQGYVEPGPVSNGYSQSGLEHPSNEAWGVKGTSLLLAAVAATAAGGVWWRRRAQALKKKGAQTEMTLSSSMVRADTLAEPRFAVASLAGETWDPLGLASEPQQKLNARRLMLKHGKACLFAAGVNSGAKSRLADKILRRSSAGGSEPITGKRLPAYGERAPLPKGYGIRTGLGDLLKPLNAEAGVTAKEDSIATYIVLAGGIVSLFLFYTVLLLINNQSVLLPPEDEFDEYVANFLPYFFFGEK